MPLLLILALSVALPSCSKKIVLEASPLAPMEPDKRTRAGGPPSQAPPHREPTPPPPLPAMNCGGRVVLTELLPDPKRVSDRTGEYVELFNPGEVAVPLNGWRITDLQRDSHVITSEGTISVPAHGFLVLGASADRDANGGIPVGYAYSDFHLSNEADRVVLENPCGDTVVDVRYPTAGNWPKHKAGRAIELVSPPSEAPTWRLASRRMPSGDLGTPGSAGWAPATRAPSPRGTPARPAGG